MRASLPVSALPVLGLLVSVLLTAACAPAPEDRGVPARGCHDQLGPGTDLWYSGEPSSFGNLVHWSSTDGTCSGTVLGRSQRESTLVLANDGAGATALCELLLQASEPRAMDALTGPWSPAFGSTAYLCLP